MGLAERVNEIQPVTKGPECGVRIALARLEQDDADALLKLLYKRLDLSGTYVSEILREEGIEGISSHGINRHRAGQCVKCRQGVN